MLDNLSDKQIAKLLHEEFSRAPDVHFILDPQSALRLVGLLQLACRHPQILKSDFELTNAVADKVKGIGPATAECINLGWDPTKDSVAVGFVWELTTNSKADYLKPRDTRTRYEWVKMIASRRWYFCFLSARGKRIGLMFP